SGLEIWCIENLRLVRVPKSSHGKFYTGNAYIVLNTVLPKIGPAQHDVHYWLGNDAKEVDSALASDKALELDAALGSCTVQYRELQGLETEKFLSYFRPCVIPVEGVYSSLEGHLNGETYKVNMLTCKGDHVVHIKEVPFSRSSLNHDDVFILDTASKIFLFSGCNSSIQERAKALDVVQYIKENRHGGKCDVATIEDGKFVGDSDVGEFWSLFGGFAPIPRDSPSSFQKKSYNPAVKLFWITMEGKLCQTGTHSLTKKMLEADKCYLLDCGTEIFVWMGRKSSVSERKISISAAEEDRKAAISHMNAAVDSMKGDPVLAQVVEDKEPDQFFLIFQTLIIFKGGMSKGYKQFIAEKGIGDETYHEKKTALFRVQGTSPSNMQAIQVDAPTWQPMSVREGSEHDIFWNALGGKAEYPREKELKGYVEDPHLFALNISEAVKTCLMAGSGYFATWLELLLSDNFKVKEIYNFTQDDLTTEDVLVLDCHREIYVWIGCHSNVRSKHQALNLGLKFLEMDILVEGLCLETPIFIVTEGHEPPFFTRFFEWDASKANICGNSFERRLAILNGKPQNLEDISFPPLTASHECSGIYKKFMEVTLQGDNSRWLEKQVCTPSAEQRSPAQGVGLSQSDGSGDCVNFLIYPYERLKVTCKDPVADIDVTKREAYLSEEDFQEKFGMTKGAFYKLPKWRQNKLKMSVDLF
ncbi:Villin-1, partial [Morella rubra]